MPETLDTIKSGVSKDRASLTFGLVIFCQTLLVYCLFKANPFGDPDSFWHLTAGDQIRALSALPETDTWSFTANGTFWYNLSWLWDAGMSLLKEHAGFSALYSLTLAIYSFAIALQGHLAFKRGINPQAIILTCYLSACLTMAGLFFRPGMMSALFGAFYYQCLTYYRESKNTRWLIPLPLIMIAWVNMHGGFLLAFVLLGVFAAETIWNSERKRFISIMLCGIACALALLVNPYGIHVFEGAMRTLGSPLQNLINEWLPLDASSSKQQLIVIPILLLLGTGQFSNSSIPFADRLLSIVLVVAVVTSVRHILLLSVLIIPYLSTCLIIPSIKQSEAQKQAAAVRFRSSVAKRSILVSAICAAILLLTYTVTPYPRDKWLGAPVGFARKNLLEPEIAFIEANYPDTRFMNYYDLGGALIYGTQGKIPVFIDGREQTAYPHQMVVDAIHLNKWQGWDEQSERLLDRYKIGGIIMPNMNGKNENPRLKEVFKGPAATVFIRKAAP